MSSNNSWQNLRSIVEIYGNGIAPRLRLMKTA